MRKAQINRGPFQIHSRSLEIEGGNEGDNNGIRSDGNKLYKEVLISKPVYSSSRKELPQVRNRFPFEDQNTLYLQYPSKGTVSGYMGNF